MTVDHIPEHLIDAAAVGALTLTILGFLPHVTAVLTFVWVCIRLYETRTIQTVLKRLGQWRSG